MTETILHAAAWGIGLAGGIYVASLMALVVLMLIGGVLKNG